MVKLQDFLGEKNKFDEIDDLFCDIIKDFLKISSTKLPNKKSDLFKEIYENIKSFFKLNEGSNIDDYILDETLPILNFCLIKTHPISIIRDIEFIKAFSENNERNFILIPFIESSHCLINYNNFFSY